MKFLHLIAILSVVCAASAYPQDESEPRSVLARGLPKRGLLAKGKQTTTTTTPPPQEEVEYEDDAEYPIDGDDGKEPSTEAPPSSTEGKKLVAGGVRPFRSNNDLLEALKRRRAQAAEGKQGRSSTTAAAQEATEAPSKTSFNKKRVSPSRESNNEDAPAPSKPSRGRFGRPSPKSVRSDPEVDEQIAESAPQPRNARTFTRRGGN